MSSPEPSTPTREQQVRDLLERGWESVSIEHRGPDGSEVIALILFAVCPVCRCTVTAPNEEYNFPEEHGQWHIEQAQFQDRVVDAL